MAIAAAKAIWAAAPPPRWPATITIAQLAAQAAPASATPVVRRRPASRRRTNSCAQTTVKVLAAKARARPRVPMPPGRVAYPAKLDWDWPKLTVTISAVSAQTRRNALAASTSRKPACLGRGRAGRRWRPRASRRGAEGVAGQRGQGDRGDHQRGCGVAEVADLVGVDEQARQGQAAADGGGEVTGQHQPRAARQGRQQPGPRTWPAGA